MPMETPNMLEAGGALALLPDGTVHLYAASGIGDVRVEGGNRWPRRMLYRLRRWLRRGAPQQTIIWQLRQPVEPDRVVPLVSASPGEVKVMAAIGPALDQVTTVTDAGIWPEHLQLALFQCRPPTEGND